VESQMYLENFWYLTPRVVGIHSSIAAVGGLAPGSISEGRRATRHQNDDGIGSPHPCRFPTPARLTLKSAP
jgi:hypothetical protein